MIQKIVHVVGARPNFMKVAPVMSALKARGARQVLVHTGQHYDQNMSEIFFEDLGIASPDVNLEVGSASHAVQTSEIMERVERVLLDGRPDWVVVYGDVNSTIAAALVAVKLGIRVAHVEAGLRSRDRTMPEEINRLLTDQIADLLFTPSDDGDANLRAEGIPENRIRLVGNVMIDTLVRLLPRAEELWHGLKSRFGLDDFGLVTLHRPSNVDDPDMLGQIIKTLTGISSDIPLLFPAHPRTRARLINGSLLHRTPGLQIMEPVGYLEFLALQRHARVVITDSGGIQEETTFLGVPCLTLRENTERPITLEVGTNRLIGRDMGLLKAEVARILRGEEKKGKVPPLWDGKTGERIAEILLGTPGGI
jgi:UDP-N-acetylglucosamine 2-epimerase (non-hydrolysing)